jgi:hypothetical protein
MPVTKVTRRLLKINNDSFNIAALVPYALPAMRLIMQNTAEHYSHHFQQDNAGDTPDWDLMQPQWSLQWAAVATGLPNFLRDIYPALYGPDGPVRIGEVGDYALLEDDAEVAGAGAPLATNAAALYSLARRHGVTHIFDGKGFTFFEGSDTDEWLQTMVLRDIQYKMFDGMDYPAAKFLHRHEKLVADLMRFGDSDLCPSWRGCSEEG